MEYEVEFKPRKSQLEWFCTKPMGLFSAQEFEKIMHDAGWVARVVKITTDREYL